MRWSDDNRIDEKFLIHLVQMVKFIDFIKNMYSFMKLKLKKKALRISIK